jgi:flavin reductase (DIM6/NTAB) family NADH-FMN oxidoreductase RutF
MLRGNDHEVVRARERDQAGLEQELVEISTDAPIWERFFVAAPLVLVATKEAEHATKEAEHYDVAPKHLAMPLGWENYFAFVCTPRHATYRNLGVHPEFTVSFPRDDRLLQASMAAGGRRADGSKPTLAAVPVFSARKVDGVLVEGCALFLECALDRVIDGFGENSLIVGRVVSASAPRVALRGPEVDDADLLRELSPLVYLAPGRFGVVRETYSFPFPADFRR